MKQQNKVVLSLDSSSSAKFRFKCRLQLIYCVGYCTWTRMQLTSMLYILYASYVKYHADRGGGVKSETQWSSMMKAQHCHSIFIPSWPRRWITEVTGSISTTLASLKGQSEAFQGGRVRGWGGGWWWWWCSRWRPLREIKVHLLLFAL